jgi:hypothetical protein
MNSREKQNGRQVQNKSKQRASLMNNERSNRDGRGEEMRLMATHIYMKERRELSIDNNGPINHHNYRKEAVTVITGTR